MAGTCDLRGVILEVESDGLATFGRAQLRGVIIEVEPYTAATSPGYSGTGKRMAIVDRREASFNMLKRESGPTNDTIPTVLFTGSSGEQLIVADFEVLCTVNDIIITPINADGVELDPITVKKNSIRGFRGRLSGFKHTNKNLGEDGYYEAVGFYKG